MRHRLTDEGERLRAAGQDLVEAAFEPLSAAQLGHWGELLDTVLGPGPAA